MDIFNPLSDLPMGFGMALSQNIDAMKHFSSLSPDEQRWIIDQTQSVQSKGEMEQLVQSLGTPLDLR